MNDIQDAIYKRLVDYSPLDNVLARYETFQGTKLAQPAIYIDAPQPEKSEHSSFFPYITMGDDTLNQWDTDTSEGYETTINIRCWSRGNTENGYTSPRRQAKEIQSHIRDALHQFELLVDGQDTVLCHFENASTIQDPDGKTIQGLTTFRLITDNA